MASLRDVFQHAGKPVQVFRADSLRGEGKAMQRGNTLLLEAKLEPQAGDRVLFTQTQQSFHVVNSEAQFFGEKIDHYRAEVEPIRG